MPRRQQVGKTIEQFSHFNVPGAGEDGQQERRRRGLQAVPQKPSASASTEAGAEAALQPESEGASEAQVGEGGERERAPVPKAPPVRQRSSRRHDVVLADKLMSDLRELGRPERTGAQRTIGAKFLAAAYVRAVHELLGERLDTWGLDADQEDEAVERVKTALRELAAPQPTSEN